MTCYSISHSVGDIIGQETLLGRWPYWAGDLIGQDNLNKADNMSGCIGGGGDGCYSHNWARWGCSVTMTPVLGIFDLIGSLCCAISWSEWPPLSTEKISLPLSHLIPEILGSTFRLIFHKNVLLNRGVCTCCMVSGMTCQI